MNSFANISGRTGRLVSVTAAVVTSVLCMAQTSGTIQPSGTVTSSRPVFMNTATFFPQVNPTLRQGRIEVANPSLRIPFRDGTHNSLVSGKVGGTTTAQQKALFPGIGFNGSYPADPQIAVSKTHIVQVTNTSIAFFSKTGSKQFEQDLGPTGFFSGLSAPSFVADPKVFFDTLSGRFFVVELSLDFNTNLSFFLIAVSDDSNPNGSWVKYKIDNKGDENSVEAWLDYPGFGYNKDAVVVTGNMFTFGMSYAGYVQAFVFKKSELIGGGTVTGTKFVDPDTFTIQAAKTDDNTVPFVYGCSLDTNSSLRVYAWRNLTTTPEMVFKSVTVPSFSGVGSPPSAGGAFLASLSGRLLDATFRSGSLLTAHSTMAPTGTTRSQVTWYEFKPGTWPTTGSPTLFQSGDVAFPNDSWAFAPAINKNSLGDITVIFTRSSSSIIADTMVASRKATDPKGQMGLPIMLGASDRSYNLSGRWGDYESVCVDPSDGFTFWGDNMMSNSSGMWGTHIVSWKVSTGGGGGVNFINASGVSVLEGTYASGSLLDFQKPDAKTYDALSVKKADGSYATAVQSTYTLSVSKGSVKDIDVVAKGFDTPSKTITGYVFLWNWTTNKWDYVRAFNVTGSNAANTSTVTGTGSTYVSTAKQVKVLFRALDPVRRNGVSPSPFRMKSDAVQLVIR